MNQAEHLMESNGQRLEHEHFITELVKLADEVISEQTVSPAPSMILNEVLSKAGMTEALTPPGHNHILSAAEIFDTFAYPGHEALRSELEQYFELVAEPKSFLHSLHEDDIIVRRAEAGLGHVAFVADPEHWNYNQLFAAELIPETHRAGKYVQVVEGGVRPHALADKFARRVTDAEGRLPYDQLVLRPLEHVRHHIRADWIGATAPYELVHFAQQALNAEEAVSSQGVLARAGLKTAKWIEEESVPLILSALEQSPVLGPLISTKLKTITTSKNFVFHGHNDTFNYKYTKLHNIIIPPGPTAANELLNIRGFYHRETDTIHLRPRSSLGLALVLLIQKLSFPGFIAFGKSMKDGLGHYFANLVLAEQGLDQITFEKYQDQLRCATDLTELVGIKLVAKAYFENFSDLRNYLTNNLGIGRVEPQEIMGDALCKTSLVRTARFASHQVRNMVGVGITGPRSVRLWMRTDVPGVHELQIQGGSSGAKNVTVTIPGGPGDKTAVIQYPGSTGHPPLDPLTKYRYRIVRTTDHESLGEGSFETSPARDSDTPQKVVIGLMSCHQPFTDRGTISPEADRMLRVLPRILRDNDVKFVLPCGDQIYADEPGIFSLFNNPYLIRQAIPGKSSICDCSADEVRRLYDLRYRMFWSMPAIRKMYANYPCYPILDDHEIKNSWGNNPEHAEPKYENIKKGALDAYRDYQASSVLPTQPVLGMRKPPGSFHYDFSYGNIGVFVMDIRSQRYQPPPHSRQKRQIFSERQFDDLRVFLQNNGHKKVLIIVSSVPVVFVPGGLADVGAKIKPSTFHDHWSHHLNRPARDAFLSLLHAHQQAHPNQRVALACGDVHIGNAYRIQWKGGGGKKPTLYQFTSSALTARETRVDYYKIEAGQELATWTSVDCSSTPYGGSCSARIDHLPGGKNPFTEPNIGLIEVQRYGDVSILKFKLIGYHPTEDRPFTYFESGWLE